MTKKLWLFILSFITILWVWVSFANPIAPTLYCHTFKNVEIDNYRIIVQHGEREKLDWEQTNSWWVARNLKSVWEVYEPKNGECIKCFPWDFEPSNIYLLDKSIDIWYITKENIQNQAIFLWEINDFECSNSYYDKIDIYKITKIWDSYQLELSKTTNEKIKRKIKNNLKEFPYAWFVTILIETICIFLIAKFNRKENQISNKKLILSWIIPTTITLPLLWFVLSVLEFWTSGGELVIAILLSYFIWELLVVTIEAVIIKFYLKISRGKSILASVLCNIASLILWAFILEWLDWLVY